MSRTGVSHYCHRALLLGAMLFGGAAVALAAPATTLLVSRGYDGGPAVTNASVSDPGSPTAMSADGRYVAFISNAQNIAPGADGQFQVFLRDRVSGTVEVVSRSSGGSVADRGCRAVAISADGRYVAFSSDAANLVLDDANGVTGVFVRDRTTGVTQRVSAGAALPFGPIAVSATGQYVAFYGATPVQTPDGPDIRYQAYLRDLARGATEMISVNSAGAPANADSGLSDRLGVSADGRYVVFCSSAANLVRGDTNNSTDVFLRDRARRITTRVSVGKTGKQANGDSYEPTLSADGRFVAFTTRAPNLVGGGEYPPSQICVRDLKTGRLEFASAGPTGLANGDSSNPALSRDGRYVVFRSEAVDLPHVNRQGNTYVRDRVRKTTTLVSPTLPAAPAAASLGSSAFQANSISDDGRYALFVSTADNLVAGDRGARPNAFVRDRIGASTERVSDGPQGLAGVAAPFCEHPVVSADGQYVAYTSDAINLVPGDHNGSIDAFMWNRQSGQTERLSVFNGAESAGETEAVNISPDGRYAAFVFYKFGAGSGAFLRDRATGITELVSLANNGAPAPFVDRVAPGVSADGRYVCFLGYGQGVAPGDAPGGNLYVRDRLLGRTECVSGNPTGEPANADVLIYLNERLGLSPDGRYVTFASKASNLVPGDTNNAVDVFVRDRWAGTTERISINGAVQGNNDSSLAAISADGRYVAFNSLATNLLPGQAPPAGQVYVRDRSLGTMDVASISQSGVFFPQGGSDPSLSADGRYVAFLGFDLGLVTGDENQRYGTILRDRLFGTTEVASLAADGSPAPWFSIESSVSGAGRFVAFICSGASLTADPFPSGLSIFLRDRGGSGGVPAAPANLSVSRPAPLQARLEWVDQSNNEALFRIERSADGGASWTSIGAAGANLPTYLDTRLAPGATYWYRVRAANEDGDSAPTTPVSSSAIVPASEHSTTR